MKTQKIVRSRIPILKAAGFVLCALMSVSALEAVPGAKEKPSSGESRNLLWNSSFLKTTYPGIPDGWYSAKGPIHIPDWPNGWGLDDDGYIKGTKSIKVIAKSIGSGMGVRYYRDFFPDGIKTFSVYMKSGQNMAVRIGVLGQEKEVQVGNQWGRDFLTTIQNDTLAGIMIKTVGQGSLWVNAPQLELGSNMTEYAVSGKDQVKERKAIKGMAYPMFWRILPDMREAVRICTNETHGGTKALRLSDTGRKYFSNGDFPVKIEKGADYRFSCWLKTEHAAGVRIHPVALGHAQNWIEELKQSNVVSGTTAWQKYELSLPAGAFPQGMEYLGVWCYSDEADSEGIAWFDDFSLTKTDAPDQNLIKNPGFESCAGKKEWQDFVRDGRKVSCFPDRLYYTDEKNANLILKKLNGNGRVKAAYSLTDGNNNILIKTKTVSFGKDKTKVPIDISGLGTGIYNLLVNMNLNGGKTFEQRVVLRKLEKQSHGVNIDRENDVLLVDRRPFIPIALEVTALRRGLAEDDSLWKDIADRGFNTIMLREGDFGDISTLMDAVHRHKMKILFRIGSDRNKPLKDMEDNMFVQIERYKAHPALLGWYYLDEPDVQSWENSGKNERDLSVLYRHLQEKDPCHPFILNWAEDSRYGGSDATDILSRDEYIIDQYVRSGADISMTITPWAFEIAGMYYDGKTCGKPVNQWIQLTQMPDWSPNFTREVTPQENRLQVYVALIYGTRLISYFMEKPMSIPLWDSLKALHDEIACLTPILTEGIECPDGIVRAGDENIHFCVREYDGKKYIICANLCGSPAKVVFNLKRGFFAKEGFAKVLFEEKSISYSGAVLEDEFKGMETKVYELSSSYTILDRFPGLLKNIFE